VDRQDPPWKVVRAFPQGNAGVLVHLHNVSGGVLAGDQLSLDLDVGPGAEAQVTSTGATRLYRHRASAADSEQRVSISVGEGALLEYLPDAVIPFSGSRHSQRTAITLAPGATLFWWEVLAPGRLASGERFAFERLQVESSVRVAGRLAFREDFELAPRERSLSSTARMGDYTHLTSFYAFQDGRSPASWRELENKLTGVAARRNAGSIWGATALASDGVMVRGLSATSVDVNAALFEFWRVARLFLTGQDAVLPRKVH
jgi:urease accessory protein